MMLRKKIESTTNTYAVYIKDIVMSQLFVVVVVVTRCGPRLCLEIYKMDFSHLNCGIPLTFKMDRVTFGRD